MRRLAAGESLRAICRDEGFPDESTVRRWSVEDEDFAPQYARARAAGYEKMADEIVEISDETEVEATYKDEGVTLDLSSTGVMRNRLRVDTRKWLLSKMLPKKFGDKLTTELTGPDGGPVVVENVVVPNHDPIAASQTYMNVMDPK